MFLHSLALSSRHPQLSKNTRRHIRQVSYLMLHLMLSLILPAVSTGYQNVFWGSSVMVSGSLQSLVPSLRPDHSTPASAPSTVGSVKSRGVRQTPSSLRTRGERERAEEWLEHVRCAGRQRFGVSTDDQHTRSVAHAMHTPELRGDVRNANRARTYVKHADGENACQD